MAHYFSIAMSLYYYVIIINPYLNLQQYQNFKKYIQKIIYKNNLFQYFRIPITSTAQLVYLGIGIRSYVSAYQCNFFF